MATVCRLKRYCFSVCMNAFQGFVLCQLSITTKYIGYYSLMPSKVYISDGYIHRYILTVIVVVSIYDFWALTCVL